MGAANYADYYAAIHDPNVVLVWRPWVPDLRGQAIDSGHHMAEENATELAAAVIAHCRQALPSMR